MIMFVARKIKADHMSGKGDALTLQLRGERAGIGLAGFHSIRDKNHRRRVIPVGKELGGLLNRLGQGGTPARCD